MTSLASTEIRTHGVSIISTRIRNHEHIIATIDHEMIDGLLIRAENGATIPELAAHLDISFMELAKARIKSPEFNDLMMTLETKAAARHLRSARRGIVDPKGFSAGAYDRVLGALGFTPHVEEVRVTRDEATAGHDVGMGTKVGFNAQKFMHDHGEFAGTEPTGTEPLDVEFVEVAADAAPAAPAVEETLEDIL